MTYEEYFKIKNDRFKLGDDYEYAHRKINNNWVWLINNELSPTVYTGLVPE